MNKDTKNQPKLNFTGTKPQTKPAVKKYRPDTSDNSNNSNSSMDELNSINLQLQAMTEGISNLREDLKGMIKKDEVEMLITNTVINLIKKLEENTNKKIEQLINEKVNDMQTKLDSIDFDNKNLIEKNKKT